MAIGSRGFEDRPSKHTLSGANLFPYSDLESSPVRFSSSAYSRNTEAAWQGPGQNTVCLKDIFFCLVWDVDVMWTVLKDSVSVLS